MACMSRLLLLLGVADLVHLVTSLLSFSLPTLSPAFHTHSYLHSLPYTLPLAQVKTLNSTTKTLFPPVQTSLVMSVYLTISLSVERYISVIHPLVSIRHHSGSSYIPLSLPAVIFSIIFTLPTYFMLDSSCEQVSAHSQ